MTVVIAGGVVGSVTDGGVEQDQGDTGPCVHRVNTLHQHVSCHHLVISP